MGPKNIPANCGCTLEPLCLTLRGIQAWWYVCIWKKMISRFLSIGYITSRYDSRKRSSYQRNTKKYEWKKITYEEASYVLRQDNGGKSWVLNVTSKIRTKMKKLTIYVKDELNLERVNCGDNKRQSTYHKLGIVVLTQWLRLSPLIHEVVGSNLDKYHSHFFNT